ncbi:ribonuclease Z [Amycolatopsis acidiphila]|uniref:Ribonuclease Z n=1 Tax=Amycolatopsis acidiphila TaxID=715473 RepID=A0A558A822_9PSEU|nr:ribonuclease Z [Amycolatopsis acidiphila]TVT20412.1 ribonuclease Z [Amycolatopsis acidiphila]UIJ59211.1 ribonuclease Z [Amycolatopsis acidiphila]GHG79151.1 ribonuclease Z [Amycolatopsis acidiphila]
MSVRELVVLGTASQVPGRTRNHNGYLLRWDAEGFLFDPGEGTQRQMLFAGVSASAINRICLTHFHGDHCLGLPGVVQRLSLDDVQHPVHAHYPASGQEYFDRLRHASVFHDTAQIVEEPVSEDGVIAKGEFGELRARQLDHPVESFGYQLVEPGGRRMLPELLDRFGITGSEIGELQRTGALRFGSRTVTVEQVSVVRRGQRFAFVMDTRLCDGVYELAERADLLVIESTFLDEDAGLAEEYGHLTARQAAQVAAESKVTKLVLTHFSQRYDDPTKFYDEAKDIFGGDVVVAADLSRVSMPKRR